MNIWIYWLIIIVIISLVEALTLKLELIGLILSAFICLVIALFNSNVLLQFIIFILLGAIFTVSLKKYLDIYIIEKKLDKYIGNIAVVTKEIKKNVIGEVKIKNKSFLAQCSKRIKVGENAKVIAINNEKLVVEKLNNKKK